MKALGWVLMIGGFAYFCVQLVVIGAQVALHQARKHGAGDWDSTGRWHWRTR